MYTHTYTPTHRYIYIYDYICTYGNSYGHTHKQTSLSLSIYIYKLPQWESSGKYLHIAIPSQHLRILHSISVILFLHCLQGESKCGWNSTKKSIDWSVGCSSHQWSYHIYICKIVVGGPYPKLMAVVTTVMPILLTQLHPPSCAFGAPQMEWRGIIKCHPFKQNNPKQTMIGMHGRRSSVDGCGSKSRIPYLAYNICLTISYMTCDSDTGPKSGQFGLVRPWYFYTFEKIWY